MLSMDTEIKSILICSSNLAMRANVHLCCMMSLLEQGTGLVR
jgi:hypothetical protein